MTIEQRRVQRLASQIRNVNELARATTRAAIGTQSEHPSLNLKGVIAELQRTTERAHAALAELEAQS